MALRETFLLPTQFIGDGTDWLYTTTIVDKAGVAIASTNLATLTLTLLDLETTPPDIVNSRNAQDIKNTNGGTITTSGVLTLTLRGLDTAMVASTHALEKRRARLEWAKTGATGDVLWKEVDFVIQRKTPTPTPTP